MLEEALAEPDPLTRARLFDELGLRGADTRPGVGLRDGLPDLLWRRVPGRPLLDGRRPTRARRLVRSIDRSDKQSVHGCLPGHGGALPGLRRRGRLHGTLGIALVEHRLELEAAVQLGRGPGWAPGLESVLAPVRIGNHPVKVTWYEAAAFARWLEHLRRDGSLRLPVAVPEAHVIRLPDEAEREWAARYPDERAFPWGDHYHSEFRLHRRDGAQRPAGPTI